MISNRKRARSTRHNYQLNCSHELPKFITNFTSNPVVSFALTPSRLMDMYHSHTHRQSLIKNLIISVHCDIIVLNLPVKEVLNVRQLGLRQKPRYLSKYRVSKSFIEICRGSARIRTHDQSGQPRREWGNHGAIGATTAQSGQPRREWGNHGAIGATTGGLPLRLYN